MDIENYDLLKSLANRDIVILQEKGKHYGDSWRKRGGIGAFMMLARKWDRIENMAKIHNYDVFASERDGVLEDIADLRRYLLLVEGHMIERATNGAEDFNSRFGRPDDITL